VCPVRLAMVLLKDENGEITYLWRTETVFTFVMLLHRFLSVNKYQTKKYFSTTFLEWLSLTSQFDALSHWSWQFLNTEISQGSVATRLRCGGMFNNYSIANLPVSLPVKRFWKSVSIWRSYGQKSSNPFLRLTVYM